MTEPLYVNEGEIAKLLNVGMKNGRKAIRQMRLHPKFPPKTIGGKRYWPAVRDFLEIWNNRSLPAAGNHAGQETNNGTTPKDRGFAWARLEAAEERVGRRLARAAGSGGGRLQAGDAPDNDRHQPADRT